MELLEALPFLLLSSLGLIRGLLTSRRISSVICGCTVAVDPYMISRVRTQKLHAYIYSEGLKAGICHGRLVYQPPALWIPCVIVKGSQAPSSEFKWEFED